MKLYYHELHTISSRNLSIQNSSFKSSEKFFIIKHLIEEKIYTEIKCSFNAEGSKSLLIKTKKKTNIWKKRHFKCCVMLYFEFTKKIHSDFDPCFVYKNCSINLKKNVNLLSKICLYIF